MKEICRNCHFLAKDYREENTDRVLSFSLTQNDRNAFKENMFDTIDYHYSLKCHLGVWDEGVIRYKRNRPHLINEIKRKNKCFFYPYQPEMLFKAAEILQKREEEYRRIKKVHKFTVIGFSIAGVGLILNALFQFLRLIKQ